MAAFVDCLTSEAITPENLIIIYAGRTPYYFDIGSLAKHYQVSKRLENPFTSIPLEPEVGLAVENYLMLDVVAIRVNLRAEVYLDGTIPLGFALIDAVASYCGSVVAITRVDVQFNETSLYECDLLQPTISLGKRCDWIITSPSSPSRLRKLLTFINSYSNIRWATVVRDILEQELTYGSCTRVN